MKIRFSFSLHFVLFLLIIVFSLIVRLYKISEIPGEWYGDISIVHEYVMQIKEGKWPLYFFLSPGPVYHYLIAPFVFLTSYHGYNTYKIASVGVSIFGIFTTYLFVRIISKRLALTTAFLMGFSFWYLSWSRLGNSQIVIPVLSSLLGYFLLRYIRKRQFINLLAGGLVSILGLYTYPQTFIFPPIYLIAVLFFTWVTRQKNKWTHILIIVSILYMGAVPFVIIVKSQPEIFEYGYIGNKILPIFKNNPLEVAATFAKYYVMMLGMYHVRGDHTLRVNIPDYPHLDSLSGIVMMLGLCFFWRKKYKILFWFTVMTLLIFPIPSVSPALPAIEIPNSGRTIAVVPYVYILIAGGFIFLYKICSKISNRFISALAVSYIFILVAIMNLNSYFIQYPHFLPNHNIAMGKIIAHYLDISLPVETAIYFSDCCWGNQGEPEPKAVSYVLQKSRKIENSKLVSDCSEITEPNAGLIFNPKKSEEIEKYLPCFDKNSQHMIKNSRGDIVAGILLRNP